MKKASIQLHDKEFEVFLSRQDIEARIAACCQELRRDFEAKKPLFIAILNGSFLLAAEVIKNWGHADCEIEFVKLKSYSGTSSTGKVLSVLGLEGMRLENRHIVIIEDIIDTGRTLGRFLPQLQEKKPASISIFSLLLKPEALEENIEARYLGFSVENKFLVGWGLDYNGLGRNLLDIYQLKA